MERLNGVRGYFSPRPDFIQGDQAVVNVERGILDALGHDRARELLPAHHEAKTGLSLLVFQVRSVFQQ